MRLLSIMTALALTAADKPLSAVDVPAGARAWTVETASVGGGAVLRAKDHVDILAVVTDPETKKVNGVMLLQNVIVVANVSPAPGEPRQLSLLVVPEEAVLLSTAKANGVLSAVLRNAADPAVLEGRVSASVVNVVTGELMPIKKR